MNNQPTIFHITHQRSGSQWVAGVLKACAPERYVLQQTNAKHFLKNPIKLGGIYPDVYLSKPDFEALLGSNLWVNPQNTRNLLHSPKIYFINWYNFQKRRQSYRKFVIIRDLRDTLISAYFSFKISHAPLTEDLCRWRNNLQRMNQEEGLLYLMNEVLPRLANIQLSWMNDESLPIKYEDLVADEYGVFEQIIEICQINISRQRLHEIIRENSFEAKTGRQRGQEDITAHQRKGMSGDWKNHFSEGLKEEFKQRFGEVLIKTGYEKDMNW